jgi:hypothetical protein
MCLAPQSLRAECSGQIVSAHTVPRSQLARIARAQHVYQVKFEFFQPSRNGLPFAPKLVGINQASTITGFCGRHDDLLFAALEKQPFIATDEQCFLLMYRAVVRELFQKIAALESMEERKRVFHQRRIRVEKSTADVGDAYELATRKGLSDIESYKVALDALLCSRTFSKTRRYVIEFEPPATVMCTGASFPECDFAGSFLPNFRRLGKLAGPPPDLITFAAVAGDSTSFVLFSWQAESDETCMPFVASLQALADSDVGDALIRYFAEFCENTYFNPDSWDQLSEIKRRELVMRLATGGSPFHERNPRCLVHDGVRFVNWKMRRRELIAT